MRMKQFLAGVSLHLIFGALFVVGWALTAAELFYYLVTGRRRELIVSFGKAEDQCANARFLRGHPKETVSSHVGRLVKREREGGIPAPWWAHLIASGLNIFDDNHAEDAIEDPFVNEPL